jgi:hypothetical protein
VCLVLHWNVPQSIIKILPAIAKIPIVGNTIWVERQSGATKPGNHNSLGRNFYFPIQILLPA